MVKTIHLAKIYFTNEQDFKVRPVLVIQENQFEDCLVLPLTTNFNKNGFRIGKDDMKEGKIKKKSLAILDKILTIHKSLFVKKIGVLKQGSYKQIKEGFCRKLGCVK